MRKRGTNKTQIAYQTQKTVVDWMMNNDTSSPPQTETAGLSPLAIGLMTGQVIMMTVMVGGNSIFLLAIIKYRKLQTINSKFVTNLSVSDLTLGLTMSFQVAFFFHPWMSKDKVVCLLRFQFVNLFSKAALYSLCLTVVDRFIAICYPLHYPTMMTNAKAYVLIAIMWVYAITIAALPILFDVNTWDTAPMCVYELVMDKMYRLYIHTEDIILPILLMSCYGYIYMIIRRHQRQIAVEHSVMDRKFSKDKKLAKFSLYVAIVFTICWLPFGVIQEIQLFHFSVTLSFVGNFAVFLGMANSAINPFIYTWKNPDFRNAVKRLLRVKMVVPQETMTSVDSTN